MKLFSLVFPKDDSIHVLETLSEKCTLQIQNVPRKGEDWPFAQESCMLADLLANLRDVQAELATSNCPLSLPFVSEEQSQSLTGHVREVLLETSMTKFLQEKKTQILRIHEKIKNDAGVVLSLKEKMRQQLEFISLMQAVYQEFQQNHLFENPYASADLRSSIRGRLAALVSP